MHTVMGIKAGSEIVPSAAGCRADENFLFNVKNKVLLKIIL
jgi:hypothetical protein